MCPCRRRCTDTSLRRCLTLAGLLTHSGTRPWESRRLPPLKKSHRARTRLRLGDAQCGVVVARRRHITCHSCFPTALFHPDKWPSSCLEHGLAASKNLARISGAYHLLFLGLLPNAAISARLAWCLSFFAKSQSSTPPMTPDVECRHLCPVIRTCAAAETPWSRDSAPVHRSVCKSSPAHAVRVIVGGELNNCFSASPSAISGEYG